MFMYVLRDNLAMNGIKRMSPMIITINDVTKLVPKKTFEIIKNATPNATEKA